MANEPTYTAPVAAAGVCIAPSGDARVIVANVEVDQVETILSAMSALRRSLLDFRRGTLPSVVTTVSVMIEATQTPAMALTRVIFLP